MNDCIFCQIINKKIPAEIVFENDRVIAFKDVNPQAPVHILVMPKIHIPTLNDLLPEQTELIGELIQVSKEIAKSNCIDKNGYRVGFNCNADAGQTVYHIHLHLLGGRTFSWPPG